MIARCSQKPRVWHGVFRVRCRRALARGVVTFLGSVAAVFSHAEIRVIDDSGQAIVLKQPARRIISLAPHVTELLFATGAGERIVGTTRYSDYPAAALNIPRIGDSFAVDSERVLQLKPDLIVVWLHGNSDAQLEQLKRLGLPVFSSEPRRLADIASTIRRFGLLTGNERVADDAARNFESQVASLRSTYAERSPVTVFYQVAERPLLTINREHIIDDVLTLCGARNVFAGLAGLTPSISAEAVVARDPEAIVTSGDEPGHATGFAGWAKLTTLRATRHHNFILLSSDTISRQSPRIVEGARMLCEEIEKVRRKR